jgi:hypothetical protein
VAGPRWRCPEPVVTSGDEPGPLEAAEQRDSVSFEHSGGMKDEAGASGYDLERLLQTVQDQIEACGDDLGELAREWRRGVSRAQRLNDDIGIKIIEAVRELLSSFPIPAENTGHGHTTGSIEREKEPMAMDLIRRPDGMAQYQSLAMLAGMVRWASRETGRSEAEILEAMAANYRH